jgi:hypothetical protein
VPALRDHARPQDCADDPKPGDAGDVGNDMVKLQIHLGQRLLHVLDVRGGVLEQTLALAQIGAQFNDLPLGAKAGTQQPVRMKSLQPLCVAHVRLAPGHMLGIACIDEEHYKAARLKELENRDPVDTGRFRRPRSFF